MKRLSFFGVISTIVLIGLWHVAATIIDSSFIIPYPRAVLFDLWSLLANKDFFPMLYATFARGITAFAVSAILSFVIGVPAGLFPGFEASTRPWMAVIRATPVVSLILIALFWFGSSIVPVFVAILMTMPIMTDSIVQGIKNTDTNLLVMARVYRFSFKNILFYIRLPSLLPYFIGGAGASLGISWKVVVAGEILAFPRFGIGTAMQTARVHLETGRVFSLTIIAVILCLITEKVFALITRKLTKRISRVKA